MRKVGDAARHTSAARFALLPAALAWRRDPLEALARLAAMDAPVLRPSLPLPVRVVFDDALARRILVDADGFGRPWLARAPLREGLGSTLFDVDGDDAMARRRLYAPVFARAHADELAATMSATITDELDGWSAGTVADLQQPLTDLTLRVATRALLGVDLSTEATGLALRQHFHTIIEWIAHRYNRPASLPAVVPTTRNRAMRSARRELREIVQELIMRRREEQGAAETKLDVLGLLLESQQELGRPEDDELIDECIGFLFAGHETTASTLAWATYHLAVAPEMQQRVAAEGDVFRTRTPSTAAVDELRYTGHVFEEALRLYPAGVAIPRVARRTTNLGGERIRRGTLIAIPVHSIHRDGRRWPEPQTFSPDRFASPTEPGRNNTLAFGAGPRSCLGARFASTEARLALAMMMSRWTLFFAGREPPRPVLTPALRMADALPVHLEPRVHAASGS